MIRLNEKRTQDEYNCFIRPIEDLGNGMYKVQSLIGNDVVCEYELSEEDILDMSDEM